MYIQINHSSINNKKKAPEELGHEYKLPCSHHTEISTRFLFKFRQHKRVHISFSNPLSFSLMETMQNLQKPSIAALAVRDSS